MFKFWVVTLIIQNLSYIGLFYFSLFIYVAYCLNVTYQKLMCNIISLPTVTLFFSLSALYDKILNFTDNFPCQYERVVGVKKMKTIFDTSACSKHKVINSLDL